MKELNYPKENLIILGHQLKSLRMKRDFSLRGVSNAVNISVSVISDIENGKTIANLMTLETLYQAIDIKLFIDLTALTEYFEKMMRFYDAFYHKDMNEMTRLITEITRVESLLENSPLMVELALLKATFMTANSNPLTAQQLKQLDDWYAVMSTPQKQRCNIAHGCNYLIKNDYQKALSLLTLNLELSANRKAHAITLEHLADAASRSFLQHKVIKYASEASRLHGLFNCVYRKIATDLTLVKGLIFAREFEEANDVLATVDYLIQNDIRFIDFLDLFHIYKAYLENNQNKYYDVIKTLTPIKTNDARALVLKAKAYYKLNDFQSLSTVLNTLTSDETRLQAPVYYHVGTVMKSAVEDNIPPIVRDESLMYLMDNPDKLLNPDLLSFAYEFMIDIFTQNNDLDNLSRLSKQLINFSDLRKNN